MSSDWELSELGKEAINATRPFSFKEWPHVVFVNTGDVLGGKFLHANVSEGKRLPGQAKKALRKNDILLTEIRPGNGRYAYVDFDASNYVVSTKFMVIESLGRLSPRFLYHVLTSRASLDEFQRIAESRSGTFPQITFDSIAHFPIPVPLVAEQTRLVKFWDELDDRITLLRETNATLEAIAQALFRSWFVDFEPTSMLQQDLRSAAHEEDQTVTEWPKAKVGDMIRSRILMIGDGYRAKNSELGTPGASFVRAGDLLDGRITPTRDHLNATSFSKANGKTASAGDTAFTSKGTIGRFAFVDADSGPAVYSPQVCFWRSLDSDVVTPEFLHYWMKSHRFTRQIEAVRGQAAIMDFVSLADQREMTIDLPPIGMQKRFSEVTNVTLARIAANRKAADLLTNIRDTLLPRLISGQLRLPDAQRELDEAMA